MTGHMQTHESHEHDPIQPHSHDPNPEPPSPDPTFLVETPDGRATVWMPADLHSLPQVTVSDCWIVSTGHGASGPFAFTGPRLADLVRAAWQGAWSQVEVISGDGFGTRVRAQELSEADPRPILLAHSVDGRSLRREEGLVRLVVPGEVDDALRQVKWVERIRIV